MASNPDNTASIVTAIIAEFDSLKEEIRARSHDQSTAISLNITAIGAIGSLYLTEGAAADPRILFTRPDYLVTSGHAFR